MPHAARTCPEFDVVMLGVGPDGHVASLFPEHPALHEEERRSSPCTTPPSRRPTRVSLTFRALCAGRDVWFLVAGEDKAEAVGLALSGAGAKQAPAAGVRGTRSTTWLLDRPAATHVPPRTGPHQTLPEPLTTVRQRRPGTAPAADAPFAVVSGRCYWMSLRSRSVASASSRMALPSASQRRSFT